MKNVSGESSLESVTSVEFEVGTGVDRTRWVGKHEDPEYAEHSQT